MNLKRVSLIVTLSSLVIATFHQPCQAQVAGGPFICGNPSFSVRYDTDVVLVFCHPQNEDGIATLAVPGATSRASSHALAVILFARATGENVQIKYRTTSGTVPGCAANCREVLWIGHAS